MKTTWPRLQYGNTIRPSKNGTSPSCAVGRNAEVAASSRSVKAPGPSISARDDTRLGVIGKADLQPGDRLLADAVLRFEPGENFSVPGQPLVIEIRQRGEGIPHPQREAVLLFRLCDLLRGTAKLRQRRRPSSRGQEVPRLAVRLRHRARLAPRDHAVMHELDKLQYIAADTAPEAVPALLVEHDVQRPMRLAAVVGAIAEERLPRLLRDAAAEEFAGDLADIDIGDLPVVGLDVHRRGSRDAS